MAAAAILGTFGLNRLVGVLGNGMPWWLDAPSVAGLYGALYQWFDRRLWRAEWLQRIGATDLPDLRGRWSGTVESSFEGSSVEIEVEIKQRWTRLLIMTSTDESKSASVTGSVLLEPGGALVIYEYVNEPFPLATETMEMHRGTAHLRLKKDAEADKLEGHYYTGRGRRNVGKMSLTRVERPCQ